MRGPVRDLNKAAAWHLSLRQRLSPELARCQHLHQVLRQIRVCTFEQLAMRESSCSGRLQPSDSAAKKQKDVCKQC